MKTTVVGFHVLWQILVTGICKFLAFAVSFAKTNPNVATGLVALGLFFAPVAAFLFFLTLPLQFVGGFFVIPPVVFALIVIAYFQLDFAVNFVEWCCPDVYFRIRQEMQLEDRRIALTIDDVPYLNAPSSFEEILDILKQHDAKATFMVMSGFVWSNTDTVEKYKDLLRRAVSEGHELGNHNMFDEPAAGLSSEEFDHKVQHCDSLLREIYGESEWKTRSYKWHRPGSGFWTSHILDKTHGMGYTNVLANCFPNDTDSWTRKFHAPFLRFRARPGCIVLLHDRWHTPETLRAALPALRKRFEIGTLSQLFKSSSND